MSVECLTYEEKITPANDFLLDSSFILSYRQGFGAGISLHKKAIKFYFLLNCNYQKNG